MPERVLEGAPELPGTADGELAVMYRQMRRIRVFEERVSRLYASGDVPGFCHVSIGQESVPVGVVSGLEPHDVITSTHRGHGHVLAKGADPREMFAELMGKATGLCRGLGGSMHIADPGLGIFGANGIVGGGLPIAVGAAHAAKARGDRSVVVAFFGDGALATGAFHESINVAALRRLPLLFVCENNRFTEFSRGDHMSPVEPHERAAGYGIAGELVGGRDVLEVAATSTRLISDLRDGAGPALLEVLVERWHGHYEGDPQSYRSEDELSEMRREDPLASARDRLSPDLGARIDEEVEQEISAAMDGAMTDAPWPDETPLEELDGLVAVPWTGTESTAISETQSSRYMDGIREALADAMAADERVYLAGIDVGEAGGIFGVTKGLQERFGKERVIDFPIAESALVGLAIGSAMAGLRPIIEIMFDDFLGVCFDQIMNQMAKLRFMTGGAVELPLVVRTQYGSGRSAAAQHSQSLEGIMAAIPGLTVVMPSSPSDAYGLLRTAIESPNPVIFMEHRHLYGKKGPAPSSAHRVPLGRANIVRPGRDVTAVATGALVHQTVAAAENVAGHGVEVEVIDLRSIVPMDTALLADSLSRTNRLAVIHEAHGRFGPAAEVIQSLLETEAFWSLAAPPLRIAPPSIPAPYSPSLERSWLPNVEMIASRISELASIG